MWFTENAWPPIIVIGVAILFLAIRWTQSQQTRDLKWIIGLCVLGPGIWMVERLIVTPREEVDFSVRSLVLDFQQKRTAEVQNGISQQAPQLRSMAQAAIDFVSLGEDLRISDVQVEVNEPPTRARVDFRVNATIILKAGGDVGRKPTRWKGTWLKEVDRWRLAELTELDPLNGSVQHHAAQVLGKP